MLRLFNILAIVLLIASAVYAYTIKYQTAYRYEQIAKTKIEIKAERDALAVLRAEWAYMTRPERLQQLADQYLPDLTRDPRARCAWRRHRRQARFAGSRRGRSGFRRDDRLHSQSRHEARRQARRQTSG
jgi:hypothetical protein